MSIETLAPIILFVYARPNHTKNTLEALAKNELAKESAIWIFSDNAKKENVKEKVEAVRNYIHSIENKGFFKEVHIIEAKQNKGLANSVIQGVTEIINKYHKVIVVEDDLVTSKYYLRYMNEALDFYEKDDKIWSISGYNPPINIPKEYQKDVYLGYRGCSWGWATWENRWNTVDWEVKDYKQFRHNIFKRKRMNRGGPDMAQMLDAQMRKQIDSWAIRWCYEQSKQNKLTVYPVESLVINQGLDGSGTHSGASRKFDVSLTGKLPKLESNLQLNQLITKNFYKKYDLGIKQTIKEIFSLLGLEKIIIGLQQKKHAKKKGLQ